MKALGNAAGTQPATPFGSLQGKALGLLRTNHGMSVKTDPND